MADILAAIDRAALKRRGTLRAWMIENREALRQRLETHKPDWPTLAQVFAEAGLLDTRGNPPTAEATRKTWYRVQATEAAKTTPASLPKATPKSDVARPVQPDDDEPPPRYTFKPGKIR